MAKIYSHSRLATFEKCPLKFKFRYIDKIPPETESIESHLGSSVHATLEWVYIQVKENKTPSIEELIIYYSDYWKENLKPETVIVKKQLTQKDYFNKGVQFILDYYTKHHPFDENTLEVEKRIFLNLDENYKIQGVIDRLVYNEETGEYEIHDYKTANNLPRKENIDSDRQLALYAIAIKELFGHEKEVCLVWHYLAHNQKIYSKRTNQQLEQLKEETLELIKEIESTQDFPSQKSILCNWCEYKDFCPEFGNSLPNNEKQKQFFGDIFTKEILQEETQDIEEEIIREEKLDIW